MSEKQNKSKKQTLHGDGKGYYSSSPSDNGTRTQRWNLIKVPIICYSPALLIVLASFGIFRFVNLSSQNDGAIDQVFTEQQKNTIAEEVDKVWESRQEELGELLVQQEAITKAPNSDLAKGYIDGIIRQEVQEQSQRAAQDEIDKLKADWKGDLFSQISFPVILAIASIFAAFAVKDILVEIIKEQERDRIRKGLAKELEDQMLPKAIEFSQTELEKKLSSLESYAYWLEYELLRVSVNQIINEIKDSSVRNSGETGDYVLSVVERSLNRADSILGMVSSDFREEELELIRRSGHEVIKTKCKQIFLDDEVQENAKKIGEKIQEFEEKNSGYHDEMAENRVVRMERIFKVQISLLKATLWKLQDDGNESIESLIKEIDRYISIDRKELYRENKEKARKARLASSVKLPPLEG
ncbi:MAG: hypothetical protein AAFW84_22590 [Cyanobacteria bacterium J06635_15]